MSFIHEYPLAVVPSAPISSPVLAMEETDSIRYEETYSRWRDRGLHSREGLYPDRDRY